MSCLRMYSMHISAKRVKYVKIKEGNLNTFYFCPDLLITLFFSLSLSSLRLSFQLPFTFSIVYVCFHSSFFQSFGFHSTPIFSWKGSVRDLCVCVEGGWDVPCILGYVCILSQSPAVREKLLLFHVFACQCILYTP